MSLRDVVLKKLEKPQTIDELFDDLNLKNNTERATIRGRLSELKKDGKIKKVGDTFSQTPTQ